MLTLQLKIQKIRTDFVTGAQVSNVTGELDVSTDGHRDVLYGFDKLRFLMSVDCCL